MVRTDPPSDVLQGPQIQRNYLITKVLLEIGFVWYFSFVEPDAARWVPPTLRIPCVSSVSWGDEQTAADLAGDDRIELDQRYGLKPRI